MNRTCGRVMVVILAFGTFWVDRLFASGESIRGNRPTNSP
jgi:hypothetical protein